MTSCHPNLDLVRPAHPKAPDRRPVSVTRSTWRRKMIRLEYLHRASTLLPAFLHQTFIIGKMFTRSSDKASAFQRPATSIRVFIFLKLSTAINPIFARYLQRSLLVKIKGYFRSLATARRRDSFLSVQEPLLGSAADWPIPRQIGTASRRSSARGRGRSGRSWTSLALGRFSELRFIVEV